MFLILTLVLLGALPIDLLLPALPAMAAHFALPLEDVALATSLYALGVAAAQPCVGPLAGRWGRKAVLVAGLALSGIAAAGVVLVEQGWALLALRALQGFGCGSLVLVHALLAGRHAGGQRVRAVAALLGAVFIALAPLLGAWLQHDYGWQAVFLAYEFLVLFAVGLMIGVLDEEPAEGHASWRSHWAAYYQEARRPGVVGYSSLAALAFACHFMALVALPVAGTLVFSLQPWAIALALLGYGIAALASEAAAGGLGQALSPNNQIRLGLALNALATAALAMSLREGALGWFLGPLLATTLGTALVRTGATIQALERANATAGAKVLGNSLTFACAGLLSLLALQVESDTRLGLLVLYVAVTLVASLVLACVTETQVAERNAVNL
ncbi:MFS transporter [Pseudomonas typographi]|uniref:Multidrug effflux MFS transporter n=1 Tax=Pseudomonas typographi TaxID=2715964 RepID=A0ABR7YZL9_9PSED|nr:MFS transporter [Pseudomonas typographi]MBD1549969.1 multidrug effflux MFS transporter [Pseudomonas typographi]MBD1585350.1 multidrug effflux MFS transporter [Pseudomonas typographi]MBD1598536.1 multidrug effflux MFS transporter [Pseudomonas typographi]